MSPIPYVVEAELSRGGGGVVSRARAADGSLVAVKVATGDARSRRALEREWQTLSRLAHPGIARVVAGGLHDDPPWYATRLEPGEDLLARVRRSWRGGGPDRPLVGPAELGLVTRLAAAICDPLVHIHVAGVVHRDLKPANVLVRDDGSIVLLDFGTAASWGGELSREELLVGGDAAGSAAYMAPEQWRGEHVDARADLHALGAILYVLLAGRPPFATRSAALDPARRLAPIGSLVAGVPDAVEELVARLLAFPPQERPGYAEDVARALGARGSRRRVRARVYRPRLAGRGAALGELRDALENARQGQGALRLLEGESGAGKTRLLMELALEARRGGIPVLAGECPAPDTGAPVAALAPLLAPLRTLRDAPRRARALLELRADVLAPYLSGSAPVPGSGASGELPLPSAVARLHAVLVELLDLYASSGPALLLLDDLQWADPLTLGLLEIVARRGVPGGLLVVGAQRAEEPSPRLRSLVDEGIATAIDVPRLDAGDVAAIVRDMLAVERAPDELSQALARHSEGNPLFVAEYLRAAVERSILRRDSRGHWLLEGRRIDAADMAARVAALAIPASLRELLDARLARLSARARTLLAAAAASGREARLELLAHAVPLDSGALQDALAELLARHVLREPEPGRLAFTHDKLRGAAYARISARSRSRLHLRLASLLEAAGCDDDAAEIARHLDYGGESERARSWHLRAARLARQRHALAEADVHYAAYLAGPGPDPARVRILTEHGEVLLPLGRTDDARRAHRTALEEARGSGGRELARPLRLLGTVELRAGCVDEARAHLEEAVAAADATSDRGESGRAIAALAGLQLEAGRPEEARVLYERALGLARDSGDLSGEGDVLGSLAVLAWQLGRMAESAGLFGEARAIARAGGDRHRAARLLGNEASLRHDRGELDAALAGYGEAARLMEELGDARAEAILLGNLAVCHQGKGQVALAEGRFEQALALSRRTGDRRYEGRLLLNLAALRHNQGALPEARRGYEAARELAARVGDRPIEATSLGNLAELAADEGRPADAERLGRAAMALHRETGQRRYEGHVVALLGDLAQARGDGDGARAAYEEALAIAREVDDRHREGLLQCRLAALERAAGRLAAAGELLASAGTVLEPIGEPVALAEHACERGHLAIAAGGSAAPHLARARELADAIAAGPASALRRRIEALADSERR